MPAESSAPARANIRPGLLENWQQFSLLVLINACVGGIVGSERTVVPLIGSEEFKIASTTGSKLARVARRDRRRSGFAAQARWRGRGSGP